jgi:23S rRNA pseudouridine2605 synthase
MTSPKTKKTVKTKKTASAKPKKSASAKPKKSIAVKPESTEPKLEAAPIPEVPKIEDPIGDETDGEAETASDAGIESESKAEIEAAEPESTPQPGAPADGSSSVGWKPHPPAKLERLQKILAAAGVASRRSAEAMMVQGRVQVNGKVVTVLGTKADAALDHIRVDGKLLQGPERHRYFVLNKPRGYVTTVKDPEGRPTVMQFFSKFSERLYPVGRLDYMSEGLLVVTNDGELANRLTKAASGVEKTYLVKVSGQPTEAELNILRGGVAIERGRPGSPPVRTSPARVRQVRQGDNPWYEVVLIEGRNRELRKMFEEIGHFVEKIRRVGYGPLVLDQEPGNLRELQPAELAALRKAAEGTLRTPKSKELRRRNLLDAGLLPTVLPKPSNRVSTARPPERFAPAAGRPGNFRPEKFATGRTSDFRPKKFGKDSPSEFPPKKFGADRGRTNRTNRTSRPTRPADSFASGAANKLFRPARPAGSFDKREGKPFRPARSGAEKFRPAAGRSFDRSPARPASRPAWKKDDRSTRPPARFAAGSSGENRPGPVRPFSAKPAWKKPDRPARPEKSLRTARPEYKRPFTPRAEGASAYRPAKAKPYPNSASRAERNAGAGRKPKPNFGHGKPSSGSRSKPKSGSFGPKRTGPRPSGNRPFGNFGGWKPGGKKRR